MAQKTHIPYLLDEPTISFYPTLAAILGVNEAIVIQQIHFYMTLNRHKRSQRHHHNNRWWVYNSYKQWIEDEFTWLSERGLQNVILGLEKTGVLLSMQGVERATDRRKWYSIDYAALTAIIQKWEMQHTKNVSSDIIQKMYDDNTQNLYDVYTENTTDKTTEKKARGAARATSKPKKATIPAQQMNAMKDAIVQAMQWDESIISKSQWGAISSAAKQLIDIGVALDEVIYLRRECDARNYRGYGAPALAKVAVDVLPRIRGKAKGETPTPAANDEPSSNAGFLEALEANLQYASYGGNNGNAE